MSVNQQNKRLDAQSFEDLHREYHHRLLNGVTGMVRLARVLGPFRRFNLAHP